MTAMCVLESNVRGARGREVLLRSYIIATVCFRRFNVEVRLWPHRKASLLSVAVGAAVVTMV